MSKTIYAACLAHEREGYWYKQDCEECRHCFAIANNCSIDEVL